MRKMSCTFTHIFAHLWTLLSFAYIQISIWFHLLMPEGLPLVSEIVLVILWRFISACLCPKSHHFVFDLEIFLLGIEFLIDSYLKSSLHSLLSFNTEASFQCFICFSGCIKYILFIICFWKFDCFNSLLMISFFLVLGACWLFCVCMFMVFFKFGKFYYCVFKYFFSSPC